MALDEQHAPAISVVVVAWNVRDELAQCLTTLKRSKDVAPEILVVDNDSKDGTATLMKSFRDIVVIRNHRNRGFAYAVNQGVAASHGTYIVLVNPDVEMYPETLSRLAHTLAGDQRIGVLGGKIVGEDGTVQRSVHRYPRFLDQALTLLKLRTVLSRTAPFRNYLADDFSYDRFAVVDQVAGALFAFPRALFDAVGGFDARYFLWFEEVDFCRRVRQQGKNVCFTPEAGAKHLGGRSAAQLSPLRRHLLFQSSMLRYFRKFHSPLHLFLLPFAIVGTLVAAVFSIVPRRLTRRLTKPSYAPR